MTAICYVVGDATQPINTVNNIIAHVCNDIGGWGAGFVLAISKRWPEPEANYRAWYAAREQQLFALGEMQLVLVADDLWVANMIGQRGTRRVKKSSSNELPPVRYDAIETALATLAEHAKSLDATVNMPRIGCGLAGGKWEEIEPLIERTLIAANVAVVVYDFE